MSTQNVVDLNHGVAYVISDLHGEAEPYLRYRDHFLTLFHQQQANYLIVLGDAIHGYGDPSSDKSLDIVLDIMRLQVELGPENVIMVLGNHELPHIYGVTLSKGSMEFTQRFEAALGDHREQVIEFFKQMPFAVRTRGGTLLTHAGPAASVATKPASDMLLNLSHDKLLAEASRLLARGDVFELVQAYMSMTAADYDANVRYYLAVSGQDDPRYFDLLRGLIVSNLKEWQPLWDYFFNQGEAGMSPSLYRTIVDRFCSAYSADETPQKVVVSGHISVQNGYSIVSNNQLRIASWSHSTPKDAGCSLLIDVSVPVSTANDLVPMINRIP